MLVSRPFENQSFQKNPLQGGGFFSERWSFLLGMFPFIFEISWQNPAAQLIEVVPQFLSAENLSSTQAIRQGIDQSLWNLGLSQGPGNRETERVTHRTITPA